MDEIETFSSIAVSSGSFGEARNHFVSHTNTGFPYGEQRGAQSRNGPPDGGRWFLIFIKMAPIIESKHRFDFCPSAARWEMTRCRKMVRLRVCFYEIKVLRRKHIV